MREETKPWLEKAEENLDTAEYMFKGARYAPTCFMCQQTLEILFKAAVIELAEKRPPKIHDLDRLFKEAGLANFENYKDFLVKASRHYFQVRYPDMVRYKYNRLVAQDTLVRTKELFLWIKEQITAKPEK